MPLWNRLRGPRSPALSSCSLRIVTGLLLAFAAGAPWRSAGAPIPGLYHTGVNDNGATLATDAVDPHYRLVQSPDLTYPGPNARVVNDTLFPIVAGPWLPSTPASKWIGPQANQSGGNEAGDYRYRIIFDLTGLEHETATLTGRWSSDNVGIDILLNGVSTGNANGGQFASWASFSISAAEGDVFLPGTNTLDFVLNNAGPGVNPTGFRAELSGVAATPNTPPSIVTHPQSRVANLGDPVSFNVTAFGSSPLSYRWRFNSNNIPGGTSRIHTIASVSPANDGAYDVVVTNPSGSVTSQVATLRTVIRIGPSSRRTGLVFSEIMYHPRARSDGRNLEYLEIHNTNPYEEDLSGYRITGDWDYTFPGNTFVPGDGFIVVAAAPADVQIVYGIAGVLGGLTNNLSNDAGTVRLRKRSGAIVLEVNYSDKAPWPIAADGTGHSMVLARPYLGENSPQAWSHSALVGGSPGASDIGAATALDTVVINEILVHTDELNPDFIELHNHGTNSVDIGGCYLTDDAATNKFRIPEGTVLGPGENRAFDETQLGFALSADGEEVFLVNAAQTRVLDAVRYKGQGRHMSHGRYPDGAPGFLELASVTRDATNAPLFTRDVVINEIMYNPISGLADDEYVELHNRAGVPVNVGGWRFTEGIDYAIPAGTTIPAGGYLVVARNASRLLTNYAGLTAASVVGDFTGRLADGGEAIVLAMPESRLVTNVVVITNTYYVVVDEVRYVDGGRWGKWADGGGSSLELIDPHSDNALAANWASSDETAKAPWTLVEHVGAFDNGSGVADRLDVFLQGAGEALLDDVEVIPASGGGNRIINPGFEAGVGNWILQGTHVRSTNQLTEGFNSARSLHLVATERGDHVANHARAMLSSALTGNATIRARARWLRGHPEILLRTKGGHIEAIGKLTVPAAPGSPGARNSQYRSNAGPVITEAKHAPLLPQAAQPLRVTARIRDPDGIQAVTLRYRLDPSTTRTPVAMVDNGTGGDELAGDGIFTGTIPGQAANAMVAFYIEATDRGAPQAQGRFPDNAPARECLVRIGETQPGGAFAAYRLWMTQAAVNTWANRPIMSNEDIDCTFVYGNNNVVYTAGSHFSGSSYTAGCYNSPIGNISGYDVNLPDDETLLGETHFTLDFLVRDDTGQREQTQYWLLEQFGLPNMYRRYVHMIVNGIPQTARSGCLGSNAIYEDVQQPSGETIEEWFPDDTEGDLYKTDCWDEFSDAGVRETGCIALNTLQSFTTTGGVKDIGRYRWNWRPRAIDGTANDFSSLFELIDAANATAPGYQSAVECIVDVPNWMRTFAMNDLSSFWDAFGNPNGKNTYLYKPENSGWKLMCWDFDVGLGTGHADPVDNPLFSANDPVVLRMQQTAVWTRLYWNAIQEAMDTFFRVGPGTPINRLLDAKYTSFVQSGVSLNSPEVIKNWITGRRNYLQTQLNSVAAPFAVSGPTTITTSNNLLVISGTAPVTVFTIVVNGVAYPITWTSATAWRMTVPISSATTSLEIVGLDRLGNPVPGATSQLNVTYTGDDPQPEDFIVINEIMYNPALSEASYVELFNISSNYTFDLSGWRINGMGYTFPAGTILTNRQFLVVAKNRGAFGTAYGWNIPVLCEFEGQLDDGGETLTLIKPGATPAQDAIIDRVTYDDDPPWPSGADGDGYSLQLLDPSQDNNRVSNWSDGRGWRFYSFTRSVGSSTNGRISFFITNAAGGDLYLDDLSFVAGSAPAVGSNYLINGGFESLSAAPFVLGNIASNSTVVTGIAHSGNASLHYVQNPGAIQLTAFYQDMPPVTTQAVYTLSFWYLPGERDVGFRARMNTTFDNILNVRSLAATPGAPNAIVAPLAPFPPLWLSEVHPGAGPLTDNVGEPEPWLEIHYGGELPLSLDGYFLANNFTNLTQWAFPPVPIQPGEYLLVWADGEPPESTTLDLHASFRLAAGNGSLVLSRLLNGTPQIVDYLNYPALGTNRSYGVHPPGQHALRQVFDYPTPRRTNDPTPAPVRVFINEWMAANASAVQDPSDGDVDDWFELYNASSIPVDLSGYRLTDLLSNTNKFTIPDGYVIPGHGFLVVWADEEENQSRAGGDLHVNFRLSAGGEEIGLYEPGGRLVDSVTFAVQATDISEGRFPDGAAEPFYSMPGFTPGAPNTLAVPPIEILDITLGPGSATLSWSSQFGRTYRIEHSADLVDWTELPEHVTATGQSASVTDNTIAAATQRFYRVSKID